MNEHGAAHIDGLVPDDGAALNDGAAPGDVIVDPQELMPHPDNYQVEAYGQLLGNIQDLKHVVGE